MARCGEVFLIAAATGLAAALSNTAPPVPDEPEPVASTAEALTDYPLPAPPELATLLTTWRVDVAGMALALGLAVTYLGVGAPPREGHGWAALARGQDVGVGRGVCGHLLG